MPDPNPNPSCITDAMWQFWLAFKAHEPTVQLGGIYANKPGYHNSRRNLPASDYSVQYALDRQGPDDKAAAIDLTFPDAQSRHYETIIKYASRLLASGRDPHDERGNYLREFYGQADEDTQVEGWDFQSVGPSTSDASHLWHIHLSFMRAYLNDRGAFDAVLSILIGETVEQWRARAGRHEYLTTQNLPTEDEMPLFVKHGPAIYVSTGANWDGRIKLALLKWEQWVEWAALGAKYTERPNLPDAAYYFEGAPAPTATVTVDSAVVTKAVDDAMSKMLPLKIVKDVK